MLAAAEAIGADIDHKRGVMACVDRHGVGAAAHGGARLKDAELGGGNALGIDDEAIRRVDACPAASNDGGSAAGQWLTGVSL